MNVHSFYLKERIWYEMVVHPETLEALTKVIMLNPDFEGDEEKEIPIVFEKIKKIVLEELEKRYGKEE